MRYIVGTDEVGLGPLAGDLFVCAIMVADDVSPLAGVTDSKALSPKVRERLRWEILALPAMYHAIARATPEEINQAGIRACHARCFVRAIRDAMGALRDRVAAIRIDGNPMPLPGLDPPVPVEFIVKGDAKDWVIGAASIVAKVERDAYMAKMGEQYPSYGWGRNSGYGTPEHIKMIREQGLTPLHRKSFCGKFLRRADPEEIDLFAMFPPDDP